MSNHIYHQSDLRSTKNTRECKHCHKIFGIPRKQQDKMFCTRACFINYQKSNALVKICSSCNNRIDSNDSTRKFCSKSCATTFNNSIRPKESRQKQRLTLMATMGIDPALPPKKRIFKPKIPKEIVVKPPKTISMKSKGQIIGPFTKIYINPCVYSGELFVSKTIRKYSPKYQHLYSRDGKGVYKFTFNVYHYPNLFDLEFLKQHGWYSSGGKGNKPVNKYGCSRDHRVSVNEAINNNYDPYYINHPLNCELMLHADNSRKHKKSSITYEELVMRVDEYENQQKTLNSVK